jgi:hypothetical protein
MRLASANRITERRLTMPHTLVRVYDNFTAALNARNALLGAGFPPSSVQLTSKVDEAGPVDGNFILDYEDSKDGPRSEFCQSLFDSEPHIEGRTYYDVAERGNHVLTVEANDEEQLARASDITKSFGAIDLAERTGKRRDAS